MRYIFLIILSTFMFAFSQSRNYTSPNEEGHSHSYFVNCTQPKWVCLYLNFYTTWKDERNLLGIVDVYVGKMHFEPLLEISEFERRYSRNQNLSKQELSRAIYVLDFIFDDETRLWNLFLFLENRKVTEYQFLKLISTFDNHCYRKLAYIILKENISIVEKTTRNKRKVFEDCPY